MISPSGSWHTRGWAHCQVGAFFLETEWDVLPGQVQVIFGPSGSGKTTTLRILAGLVRPTQGHIEIGGRVVYDDQSDVWVPPHQRRVGYLTQQYHLFPHLTVAENIAYGLSKRAKPAAKERVHQLVQAFHLEGLEQRRSWELSGGEQQQVTLARALASEPDVLLLDEPFAAIDMELRRILQKELRTILEKTAIPILLVTHDREEALALGDSIQVIDRGRPIARGEPLTILGQPGRGRVARLMGIENLLRLRVESRDPQNGTMICVSEGLRLEVPLDDTLASNYHTIQELAEEETITVGIRASDIILAREEPQGTSARNRICGLVQSVELCSAGYEVILDCVSLLRCHITGSALTELGVEPGLTLWAIFKASSCFLVQEQNLSPHQSDS
jgi:molybdate transport system ATP-binding protein